MTKKNGPNLKPPMKANVRNMSDIEFWACITILAVAAVVGIIIGLLK